MKKILVNWPFLRVLRLAIGIYALVEAIVQKDAIIGVLAAFLLVTALTNVGCCGTNGCAVNVHKKRDESGNE